MKVILTGYSESSSSISSINEWGKVLTEIIKNTSEFDISSVVCSFSSENKKHEYYNSVEKDDLVLIQFDSINTHKHIDIYTHNWHDFIKQVKSKGANIILCTPTEKGTPIIRATEYKILRELSYQMEIPLFDLNRYSYFLYKENEKSYNEKISTELARYVTIRLRQYLSNKPLFKKLYYGACMYPEVWSQSIFENDVKHMSKIGMNFARFGEFAWKNIEPEEGCFDLNSFEEALKIYQKYDIDVCVCIPTPTPPRWFTKNNPNARIKNIDGTVMEHGSRQHVCTNNPSFRKYAYRMTKKVASLAKKYPNIIAFQLDNEFKCHVDLCYCDVCKTRWYEYLELNYQSIEKMNEKWGTHVWSEYYDTFDSVILPTKTPFLHNSSLMNAFRKFTAETINEFAHDLSHYIRMETAVPITHNSAFGFNLMNDRLFSDLDVVGFDTYAPANNYPAYTMNIDRWRNVNKSNDEVLLLETSTSHNGHIGNYAAPAPPGWITAELFCGFAGNLKTFTYWHYRSHRFGVEQPHSAVVTAWGEPDIGYEDVVDSGKLTAKLQDFLSESQYQKSKIAFMYSDHSKRFYTIEDGGMYDYRTIVTDYYSTLIKNGLNVEIIDESYPYNVFDVLIVPFVRWISPTVLEKFKSFVEKGGKLILGPMTGDRTEELSWPAENGLDIIGDWLKINKVKQYSVEGINYYSQIIQGNEKMDRLMTSFECPKDWERLASTEKGTIISAKGKVGAGEVIYIGGLTQDYLTNQYWKTFIESEILPYDADQVYLGVNDGLKKYRRKKNNQIHIYVVNMSNVVVDYDLYQDARELLTEKSLNAGVVSLEPYEYQILSFPASS